MLTTLVEEILCKLNCEMRKTRNFNQMNDKINKNLLEKAIFDTFNAATKFSLKEAETDKPELLRNKQQIYCTSLNSASHASLGVYSGLQLRANYKKKTFDKQILNK